MDCKASHQVVEEPDLPLVAISTHCWRERDLKHRDYRAHTARAVHVHSSTA